METEKYYEETRQLEISKVKFRLNIDIRNEKEDLWLSAFEYFL